MMCSVSWFRYDAIYSWLIVCILALTGPINLKVSVFYAEQHNCPSKKK